MQVDTYPKFKIMPEKNENYILQNRYTFLFKRTMQSLENALNLYYMFDVFVCIYINKYDILAGLFENAVNVAALRCLTPEEMKLRWLKR